VVALSASAVRLAPLLRAEAEAGAESETGRPVAADVTVVIAARDEAERIEETVRRALAQREVARVVVADDRSSDATPAILERLRAEFAERGEIEGRPRLAVVRIDELPAGWLGKPHALHLASREAATDWLLFTDADAHFEPGLVAAALNHVERANAGGGRRVVHLAALPGYEAAGVWGAACTLGPYLLFIATCAGVTLGLPGGVGVGAFNLVRRDAYERVGGHERLAMEVVDDVKLGILLRRHAGRSRVAMAPELLRIDWVADAGVLSKLLEKNCFAMAHYSVALATMYIVGAWFCWALGVVSPVVVAMWVFGAAPTYAGAAGVLAGVGFWGMAPVALLMARRFGWPALGAALAPLGFPTMPLIMWRSMRVTLGRRGVTWRGVTYPLGELRRRQVW